MSRRDTHHVDGILEIEYKGEVYEIDYTATLPSDPSYGPCRTDFDQPAGISDAAWELMWEDVEEAVIEHAWGQINSKPVRRNYDADTEADLQKHFGPWPNERCWSIKEKLPIKVKISQSWTGKGYDIIVPPMKMTYDTFGYINSHVLWPYDHAGPRKPSEMDVYGSSYNYETGEAQFRAYTKADLDKWLDYFSDYVYA